MTDHDTSITVPESVHEFFYPVPHTSQVREGDRVLRIRDGYLKGGLWLHLHFRIRTGIDQADESRYSSARAIR